MTTIIIVFFAMAKMQSQTCTVISEPASYRRLVVTHTGTEGGGSLRQAILCANSHISFDTIVFQVPPSDPNYRNPDGISNNGDEFFNLSLAVNDLPTVTDTLVIDGLTQLGSVCSEQALVPTFSGLQKGYKPQGMKFVVNGGGLNKQGIDIQSSATLLIIRGIVFVNWVNASAVNGSGTVRLLPLTPSSLITLDCAFMSSKI